MYPIEYRQAGHFSKVLQLHKRVEVSPTILSKNRKKYSQYAIALHGHPNYPRRNEKSAVYFLKNITAIHNKAYCNKFYSRVPSILIL